MIYTWAEASLMAVVGLGFLHIPRLSKSMALVTLALQIFLTLAAFGIYAIAHGELDERLLHVAQTTHADLPLFYRIAAMWSDHAGSFFLWITILGFVIIALMVVRPSLMETPLLTKRLGISVSLLHVYGLSYANPFSRSVEASAGILNPLLHDISLGFHPPVMYLGQIGMLIVSSMIIVSSPWHRAWLVTPLLCAWGLLTIGITWGSLWAYYELGWGGWWFWDPVENVALLPWLLGVLMIHSYRLRNLKSLGVLAHWLVVSILSGVFLVRSGMVSSVHSFTFEPAQSTALLLTLFLVGLIMMFPQPLPTQDDHQTQLQAPQWFAHQRILIYAITIILTITLLASLTYRLLAHNDLNFHPEFFEITVVPLLIVVLGYLGYHFRTDRFMPLVIALGFGIVCFLSLAMVFAAISGMIAVYTITTLVLSLDKRKIHYAAFIAHMGVGIAAFSVSMNQMFHKTNITDLASGQTTHFDGFQLRWQEITLSQNAISQTEYAHFSVRSPNHKSFPWVSWYLTPCLLNCGAYTMSSQVRTYPQLDTVKNVVALRVVYPGILLITHKRSTQDPEKLTVYMRHDPFVLGIWFGGLLIALGAFMSLRKKPRA